MQVETKPGLHTDTGRWDRLKDIVYEACQRPADERDAFLDETCGNDAELRREAASLVGFEEEVEDFIEKSPASQSHTFLQEGDRIDSFRIRRLLGKGGMGQVYLAERADGTFEQQVAIKVMRPDAVLGELVRRAFSERQLLAELNHPNIAHLLDGGDTEDGRPYLVMEYVDGEPIDRHCENRELSIEQRLRLFLRVCAAVRHAHQHLVIHRDLKPGNILVTHGGVPKLLDFGVAKDLAGARTPDTTFLVPASPGYASPEQLIGGLVTTASDVYALGVVLYEILAGENPFGDARDPFAGRTSDAPPSPPSEHVRSSGHGRRISRRLAGDLDHIVLRAIEPDVAKRYTSVEQLVRDLERHLDGLPLETRAGTLYRIGKAAQRHWKALAATTAILGLTFFWFEANRERQNLEREAALANRERQHLERENVRITTLSDELQDYLIKTFLQGDPTTSGQRNETVEHMVDYGVELLEGGAFTDEPMARTALLTTFGKVYRGLDLIDRAEQIQRRVLELRQRDLPPDDEATGRAHNNVALILRTRGRYQESRDHIREAMRILRFHDPGDHSSTAIYLNNLAGIAKELGHFEDAIVLYRESLEMKRRLDRDLWSAMTNLGSGLLAAGLLDEVETVILEAQEELSGSKEANPINLAVVDFHHGVLLRHRGELSGARKLLDCSYQARVKGLEDENHKWILEALLELAIVDDLEDRLDDAEIRLRRVVDGQRLRLGADHPDLAKALVPLARVLAQKGNATDATVLTEEALAIFRRSLPADHWRIIDAEQFLTDQDPS